MLPLAKAAARRILLRSLVLLVLAVALALAGAPVSMTLDPPTDDVLPDLGMARLTNLSIERTTDGRRLLRFDSVVVNVGDGPFEVHGQRPDISATDMSTSQRIFDSEGGSRDVPTEAQMYFGGDGHNHWHVRDLEKFRLTRIDPGPVDRTGAKHGFCFFDNYPYGSEEERYYTSCGGPGDLTVTMGLSAGWGDLYSATLPDQYVEITGLKPGRYRLKGTADASDWFVETDEYNNFTWVDLRIKKGGRVKVTGYGPSIPSDVSRTSRI